MFWNKKTKKVTENVTENTVETVTSEGIKEIHFPEGDVTVKDIHTAFNNEVDRLLHNCKIKHSLETELEDILNKHERLSKLGFKNTKISDKAKEEQHRLNALEEANENKLRTIDAIEFFQQKYPHYKFLTQQSLSQLCEKYGLVYGSVEYFIGDVPEKNIIDIENFSIKDEDCVYTEQILHSRSWTTENIVDYDRYKFAEKTNGRIHNSWGDISYLTKEGFIIVAPVKDFNTNNLNLVDNELKRKPIVNDDPIVLMPVLYKMKKYFLIVTAWGEEASDELVMNPNHN